MDSHEQRKRRGAFFTPPDLASYLVEWAIRSREDTVLEPSCGEASFLLAAGKRLKAMGANPLSWQAQLHGVEIYETSARKARNTLRINGFDAHIDVSDFFAHQPERQYDAVVGNPPFVRYQNFSGFARTRSLEAALAQGVRLSGLASSWAAFVVKASLHLAPSGRLALVLPAELLSVKYAQEVRQFLLKRFGSVRIIVFKERIFPGVLEEVVLLLAEGTGGTDSFEVYQSDNIRMLEAVDTAPWTKHQPGDEGKWTLALLAEDAFTTYRSLTQAHFELLGDWGSTYLGSVTGNNRFFTLTREETERFGLGELDLIRISPPGSRHLRGVDFSRAVWDELVSSGARGFLFYPRGEPSEAARQYIEHGTALGVANAYKCRTRRPWWRVPLVEIPDLFLTYMNHDSPRLLTNSGRVQILNSLYGIQLHDERKCFGKRVLPLACLNSVTLLGSEVVGRAYGGGLLKLEPREADKLPVPSLHVLQSVENELHALKPMLIGLMRDVKLAEAVKAVDSIVLPWISECELNMLRTAREMLFQRRRARGRCGKN